MFIEQQYTSNSILAINNILQHKCVCKNDTMNQSPLLVAIVQSWSYNIQKRVWRSPGLNSCAIIVFMSIRWTVQCYEMVLMGLFCSTNGNYSQREITAEMFFDLLSDYSTQKHMQTFSCCFRRITSSCENSGVFLWQMLCEEENTPRINKTNVLHHEEYITITSAALCLSVSPSFSRLVYEMLRRAEATS